MRYRLSITLIQQPHLLNLGPCIDWTFHKKYNGKQLIYECSTEYIGSLGRKMA